MNKPAAVFATTTALFAASTFHFWQKAQMPGTRIVAADAGTTGASATARGTPAAGSAGTAPSAPAVTAAAKSAASPATAAAARAPAPALPAARTAQADAAREKILPFAKDWLRQYDDSTQRLSLQKAARAGIEAQYSRLRDRLKLDATTFGQLVDLLTQEQLEQQAGFFRCVVDATCDTNYPRPPRDHSDEYLAMLGPDAFAQFNAYRQAMPEWQAVVQLRGRLGEANYLRDGDAERLLSALSAERERYVLESNQAGAKLRGWGTGTGMVWYSGDGGVDEQLASAAQYSDRMRQRAASILNAEQLRAFVQLQDELLANFANYLRQQSGG
jgi:hypothetical protein